MSGLTAVTISSAFVFGMVLALLGSIKLALAKRLNLGEGRIAGLLSALNLALIPMMLLSGLLIDKGHVRWVVIGGSAMTAVAVFLLSVGPSYGRAFGCILLAGAGGAALSTASILLMPAAFFPDQLAASLNLGSVFFALGALITPPLTDVLMRTLEFRRTVTVIAVLCLEPAVVAGITPAGEFDLGSHGETARGEPGYYVMLWVAGLVFFLYTPLEGAISIWATTYLTDLGVGERRSAWLLSGFWTTFMAARLLAAVAQHRGWLGKAWDPWVIVLAALLAAVALGNMAGTARAAGAWRGLLVVGFFLGPIFPTLVGLVFDLYRQERGMAYGTMFAIGSTGGLVLAPLIGTSARRSVKTSLRIPMILALVLTAVSLVFALMLKR
jgi:fucose permease